MMYICVVVLKTDRFTDTEPHSEGTTVRDSVVVPLYGLTIPANGFIHLYDTTPYVINNGHVAANVPCGDDSSASLNVLICQAPNLTDANLEYITELSNPGQLCLYHVDLESSANQTITDVGIQNPGTEDVELPPGSTVVIAWERNYNGHIISFICMIVG